MLIDYKHFCREIVPENKRDVEAIIVKTEIISTLTASLSKSVKVPLFFELCINYARLKYQIKFYTKIFQTFFKNKVAYFYKQILEIQQLKLYKNKIKKIPKYLLGIAIFNRNIYLKTLLYIFLSNASISIGQD